VLKTFDDPRIRLMPQSNAGQAASWNRAFKQSTGELILFLDSDDFWRPNKIERMVDMHLFMHARYSVLQHNLTVISNGKEHSYRRILPTGDCFAEMKATGRLSFFVTSSGLGVPRSIAEKVFPIPEQLRISPDAFLTRSAFVYAPVIAIPEELGYLRLHGANAGMSQPQEFHDDLRRELIFPALNEYYSRHGIDHVYTLPKKGMLARVASRIVGRLRS
jgi:glycosyltransferase involved in cell wall biosynthesis